ncbi:SDR family oxidoreductase [Pseudarthrobacter sp. R1]|uniref:SDR family NAD(P)-dependent oxidoreductase n=1 Tax=Pseudarthrobacter sp. R1 TaxID=2944934 RepID=UPI00210B63E7|nr:SDR family oxidoreductase [Pseudarthrobacter sp. R1]MCQ6272779.1 SDR family oxidoreductase [Pseudarthrobacter sp. R1]
MFDMGLEDDRKLFQGESVIVTGAAQGLGLQIAASFAARGAGVLMADRNKEGVESAADELQKCSSSKISWTVTDVSDETSVTAMKDTALAEFGRIDHLVNNAGILHIGSTVETPSNKFRQLMDVNVLGVHLGMQAVLPVMLRQGSGSIVNLSSLAGKKALENLGAYCASKAAVLSLTQVAALEYAPTVRVNAVCPGVVETPMQQTEYQVFSAMTGKTESELKDDWLSGLPMGQFQQPVNIAEAVCFLASKRAAQITGEAVAVNGGLMMD